MFVIDFVDLGTLRYFLFMEFLELNPLLDSIFGILTTKRGTILKY